MSKSNREKIENAKPSLKEKVCFALALGFFAAGAIAWGGSIVLALSKAITIPQMVIGSFSAFGLTGAGFGVGVLGVEKEKPESKSEKEENVEQDTQEL